MRKPKLSKGISGIARRVFAAAVIIPGVGLASLGGFSSPASAATTITQSSPNSGGTLAGTAFTGQLEVAGSTGTVAFSQAAGSNDVQVSPSGLVSTASSLPVGNYTASGTDADQAGDSGTWTFTVSVLAPAPSGFTSTVDGVYQSVYTVDQLAGGTAGLDSVTAYESDVSQLDAVELAEIYGATQQDPEWSQIPALMDAIAAEGPSSASSPKSGATQGAAGKARAQASNLSMGTGQPGQLYQHESCPNTQELEYQVFQLQEALDATQLVYNVATVTEGASSGLPLIGEPNTVAAAGVAIATAAAEYGVEAAHDDYAWQIQQADDCNSSDTGAEIDNIDTNAVDTYNLLNTTANVVAQIQTTGGETQQAVLTVESQLTGLQTSLQSAIASDIQGSQTALQSALGTDIQGLTTQLQTDASSLSAQDTTIEQDLASLGQSVNANTSAIAAQSQTQLLFQIQNALGTARSIHSPDVQLMLPTAQGGYLNSLPIGVQEVVDNAFSSLEAIGVSPSSTAKTDWNAATYALAHGEWISAYNYFVDAYQALP